MIRELVKLANHLDSKGLQKEADYLDRVIQKIAENSKDYILKYRVKPGDTFSEIIKELSPRSQKENVDLNKAGDKSLKVAPNPDFRPDDIKAGKFILIYSKYHNLEGEAGMRVLSDNP